MQKRACQPQKSICRAGGGDDGRVSSRIMSGAAAILNPRQAANKANEKRGRRQQKAAKMAKRTR